MKSIRFLALAAILALAGCATAKFSSGTPFDTTRVSSIQKDVTTKAQVLTWFGQPFTKSVAGADGETWVYMYSQGQSHAQSRVFTMDVTTTGTMQQLQLFFAGDVVKNFTFTDGGLPNATMDTTVGR